MDWKGFTLYKLHFVFKSSFFKTAILFLQCSSSTFSKLHIFRVSDLSLFFPSIFCITGLKPCKSWSEKTNWSVDAVVLKGQTFTMKLCGVGIWSHLMETTLCRTTPTFVIFASFWIMWLLVGSLFCCETVWWVVRKRILSLCGQIHLLVIQMIEAAHTSPRQCIFGVVTADENDPEDVICSLLCSCIH